ncbi:MAG: Maf family protein [Proteobacteria bacterium]|jgi:septum formation protein|nr:Maf family protein [Pseudomonadota bacterium]
MTGLVLASTSPRRAALLRQLGLHFAVRAPAVNEAHLAGESPVTFVRRLSLAKANSDRLADLRDRIVLAADTVVLLDEKILGKPGDPAAAMEMLAALSGRVHRVMTGVALVRGNEQTNFAVETKVEFRTLSKEEIRKYCVSGEPFDKAGGYGIQGRGAVFVSRIDGSYSNVVGLPLMETAQALTGFGIDCLDVGQRVTDEPTF